MKKLKTEVPTTTLVWYGMVWYDVCKSAPSHPALCCWSYPRRGEVRPPWHQHPVGTTWATVPPSVRTGLGLREYPQYICSKHVPAFTIFDDRAEILTRSDKGRPFGGRESGGGSDTGSAPRGKSRLRGAALGSTLIAGVLVPGGLSHAALHAVRRAEPDKLECVGTTVPQAPLPAPPGRPMMSSDRAGQAAAAASASASSRTRRRRGC